MKTLDVLIYDEQTQPTRENESLWEFIKTTIYRVIADSEEETATLIRKMETDMNQRQL